MEEARQAAQTYAAQFDNGCFYIELYHHLQPYDDQRVAALTELAEELGLPTVAANQAQYPRREGKPLCDVITAIRPQPVPKRDRGAAAAQ